MNKAVGARRADGLFVKAHRRRARGPSGARSRRRPARRGSRSSPGSSPPRSRSCRWWAASASRCRARWSAGSGLAAGGAGQARRRNDIPAFLERCQRCPQQPLRPRCRLDGRSIVARKEARLQLSDPVPAFRQHASSDCPRTGARSRSSSNSASSKEPNFGVKPRSVRTSPSCAAMRSTTRPNRTFCANSRPCSASRCTSTSGSPAARRFEFR